MKEFKVVFVEGDYYLRASKFFYAEPDATPGFHGEKGKDMFIIAKDYNQAQLTLVAELSKQGFYS